MKFLIDSLSLWLYLKNDLLIDDDGKAHCIMKINTILSEYEVGLYV